ncbi:MAG TPA: ABC transporter permease [Methylophaga aminisulfidivorans]|uniref:Cell division protein FtsX n=2 Tax=root TaxID=1 RepID=A0A7C1ZVG3_9GAMM|nr:ABC transporter permease [Methylophaga aminisulfidivorans]
MLSLNLPNYLLRHLQVMLYSLGQLTRTPVASVMTVLVIGIAIALPAGLYVMLHNIEKVTNQWDDASQISVFLQHTTNDSRGKQLASQLTSWPDIESVDYRSASEALNEFRELSGMDEILDTLPKNPLPPVLLIHPTKSAQQEAIQQLLERLQAMQEVELAELDMAWLQRLRTINETGQRGITIIAVLLSISVLLVIGNTIRLAILSRQTEIKVIKLVGGTNAFVRRPFLYTGFWYGLVGGIIAWLTLLITLLAINGPINKLASLYESQFNLEWLSGQMFISLPLFGLILGVMGAWLAVGRHLNDIEPS